MNLFMLKTLEKVLEYMEISKELFFSVTKLFAIAPPAMTVSEQKKAGAFKIAWHI